MTYARGTSVSPEKSKAEIEKTLRRYGAGQFVSGWDADRALIGFTMKDRQIRFTLMLPPVEAFQKTDTGRNRSKRELAERAREQAIAERWRALLLVIKAKLEAVEAGIALFEDEFLANTVLPNGSTVGQWAKPQLDAAYETGSMPKLLGAGS
jgi:hypothetical protein